MGKSLQFLLIVLVGVGIGFLVGPWLINDTTTAPPLTEETASPERLTALYLAAASTRTADSLAARPRRMDDPNRRSKTPHHPEDKLDEEVFVPSLASADDLHDDDMTLIPRGPGKWAILDLEAGATRRLVIHRGKMERDGDGDIEQHRAKPKVGLIRGDRVPVELLHLGFDEEGRAVVAHIRTTDDPPVEGIVILARETSFVSVRPWRPPADEGDEETAEAPQP